MLLSTHAVKDGEVKFAVDRPGTWLIRLVHMRRCQADPEYDWESFWGAHSFKRK